MPTRCRPARRMTANDTSERRSAVMRSNEQRVVAVASKENEARRATRTRCRPARRITAGEQRIQKVGQRFVTAGFCNVYDDR